MGTHPDDFVLGGPTSPLGGLIGCDCSTGIIQNVLIERDVMVPMRDGERISIDVYRPQAPGRRPALIRWGASGNHNRAFRHAEGATRWSDGYPIEIADLEAAEILYWCRNGYLAIKAFAREESYSCGDLTSRSEQEVEDMYDLIEWAGTQEWSNGKVGMQGLSLFGLGQWKVAALNPPHLAAINPWEGVSDLYRDLAFHGGIPETLLCPLWSEMQELHPMYDDYWGRENPCLSRITVPALIVASWGEQGLGTRGAIAAFQQISSRDKWLVVHARKKGCHFYRPESLERPRQFFNRFLKGIDNRVKDWPPVVIEIREKCYVDEARTESEWPIARTQYTKYYLDAATARLSTAPPTLEWTARYNVDRVFQESPEINEYAERHLAAFNKYVNRTREAPAAREPSPTVKPGARRSAKFEFEFTERTEVTGHMSLRLWVEADGSDDLDLFVALEKLDEAGYLVPFAFLGNHDDGPVALGWLRASHRELDEERSRPWQPVHTHTGRLKLDPGEIVPVDVEIWPASTLFERGEKLRLVIQGGDIYSYPTEPAASGHLDTVNRGDHVIHAGGKYDSHLLVPVIPPRHR